MEKEINTFSRRFPEIDIVKSVAFFLVIFIHYLEWYVMPYFTCDTVAPDKIFYIALSTIADCCVPLFFVATGFLLYNRRFSFSNHYVKLKRVIIEYLAASIILGIIRLLLKEISIREFFTGLLTCNTAPYGWYVRYYVVLFLIIPIINAVFDKFNHSLLIVVIMAAIVVFATWGGVRYIKQSIALYRPAILY